MKKNLKYALVNALIAIALLSLIVPTKLHAQDIVECKREYVILDEKYRSLKVEYTILDNKHEDLRKAHLDSCVRLSMQKKIYETEKAAYVKAAKWGKFRAVVRAVGIAIVVGLVVGKVI